MIKDQLIELIREQPDDSTAEEIIREIALSNIVERGLADSDSNRTISNSEMWNRIQNKWK